MMSALIDRVWDAAEEWGYDYAKRAGVAHGARVRADAQREGIDPLSDEQALLAPLSGEWAGDPTPTSITHDAYGFEYPLGDLDPSDLGELEQATAEYYESGYFEALAGDAKPCVIGGRSEAICMECGTYCGCDVCARPWWAPTN